jgi:sugar lactone lactonase YvrE
VRKSAIVAFALAAALVACGGAVSAAPPRKQPRPQPVLGTPGPLALTPDGRALLVGDRTFRRVLRIDLRTKRRTTVIGRLPDAPVSLAFDDNGRLFVASGPATAAPRPTPSSGIRTTSSGGRTRHW